jgi:sulfotransferase family protein
MTTELVTDPGAAGGWSARVRQVGSAGRAAIGGLRLRRSLADLERFCFFLGYARSGTTLVGALLNAHPEIVIANELDVLQWVERGVRRNQLFALLLQRDRQFAALGNQWTDFDYTVPGQFQGRFERLRVLGDKRAGRSTHLLGEHPRLLDDLRRTVGVPIRVVHVVRNPYDTITTMAWRGQGELAPIIERYQRMSDTVDEVRSHLAPEELIDVGYESFVAHPEERLGDLCRFLGVVPSPAYLRACAGLVEPTPSRSRDRLPWSPGERSLVDALIGRRTVLAGYEFDA